MISATSVGGETTRTTAPAAGACRSRRTITRALGVDFRHTRDVEADGLNSGVHVPFPEVLETVARTPVHLAGDKYGQMAVGGMVAQLHRGDYIRVATGSSTRRGCEA